MFGDMLRSQMVSRGETQDQLGELVGVDGATVSRWLDGSRVPRPSTVETLCRIHEVHGVRRDELYAAAGHIVPEVERLLLSQPLLMEWVRISAGKGGVWLERQLGRFADVDVSGGGPTQRETIGPYPSERSMRSSEAASAELLRAGGRSYAPLVKPPVKGAVARSGKADEEEA